MSDGLKTFISTTMLTNILRLGSNMLLASWLSPDAFALAGIVGSIVFAFEMFSDAGFKAFVLRHIDGDKIEFLNSVWTIRLIRSLGLGVLFFLFSSTIADFFNISDLLLALQITSLSFMIRALEPIGFLLAERQGNIDKVLQIEFFIFIAVTLITAIAVYFTGSFWPLIFAAVLNSLLHTVAGYLYLGRFGSSWSINIQYIKELLSWAKFIVPSSIITFLLFQLDKFILGKSLTVTELGLYYIAFNFSSAALNFVINYCRRILEPYMANIYRNSPENFKTEFYLKKTRTSAKFALIIGAGVGGADIFFDVFYDDRYSVAAGYLKILLIAPALSLLTYSGEVSLILHGKVKMTLMMNLLRLFWLLITTWLAYKYFGIKGIIFTFASIELLPMLYVWLKLSSLDLLDIRKELLILLSAVIGILFGLFASNIISLI